MLRRDLGRWISVDPYLFIMEPPSQAYPYASSHPTFATDPSGLFCIKIGGICIGWSCKGKPWCPPSRPAPPPPPPSPPPRRPGPFIVGCTPKQIGDIQKNINDICKSRIFLLPSQANRRCLRTLCGSITIQCAAPGDPGCVRGTAGYTPWLGGGRSNIIVICGAAWSPEMWGCLGRTILHEMIHACGNIGCPLMDPLPGSPAGPGTAEHMMDYAYAPGTPPCPT